TEADPPQGCRPLPTRGERGPVPSVTRSQQKPPQPLAQPSKPDRETIDGVEVGDQVPEGGPETGHPLKALVMAAGIASGLGHHGPEWGQQVTAAPQLAHKQAQRTEMALL
ncbi:MAG: hypothetical protein ACK55I_20165, partial [bacterium]